MFVFNLTNSILYVFMLENFTNRSPETGDMYLERETGDSGPLSICQHRSCLELCHNIIIVAVWTVSALD